MAKSKASEQSVVTEEKKDQKKEIVKHDPRNVPAYLKDMKPEGLEQTGDYQSTPILKVVHPTSKTELQDEFGVGTVIANGEVVAEYDTPFTAVPLFFWPSWQKRRDKDDKSDNFVVAESFDKESDLAKRSRNPDQREEPYENNPKWKYKYAESLNFAVEITSGPMAGTLAVVKFSIGGHAIGRRLCGYLQRRGVPIYCNVLELSCIKRSSPTNTWFQIDFNTPEACWVAEGDVERYKAIHTQMKNIFSQGLLNIGREDETKETGGGGDDAH